MTVVSATEEERKGEKSKEEKPPFAAAAIRKGADEPLCKIYDRVYGSVRQTVRILTSD